LQAIANKDKNKAEELLSVLLNFETVAFNSLIDQEICDDLFIGLGIGGRGYDYVNTVDILYGWIKNGKLSESILGTVLGGISLADSLLNIIQQTGWDKLNEFGGRIVPVKLDKDKERALVSLGPLKFFKGKRPISLEGNLNIGIFGNEIKILDNGIIGIDLDVWVTHIDVGLDFRKKARLLEGVPILDLLTPGIRGNLGFLGDNLYLIRTKYGSWIYNPVMLSLGKEGKIGFIEDKKFMNIDQPGENFDKVLKAVLTRLVSKEFGFEKDYPQVPIFGFRAREALEEARFNQNPYYVYVIERPTKADELLPFCTDELIKDRISGRQGTIKEYITSLVQDGAHLQVIKRIELDAQGNKMKDREVILSIADIFYEETKPFLTEPKHYAWMEPNETYRIPGMAATAIRH
jgi:hypothetical protein